MFERNWRFFESNPSATVMEECNIATASRCHFGLIDAKGFQAQLCIGVVIPSCIGVLMPSCIGVLMPSSIGVALKALQIFPQGNTLFWM
ncbi:hypothetical protein COLO4_03960 [Corchorus olitorius]|uniref:Uncharacterized protein n=1 Tax=Corchorus olitorius TaxID=93759 RepID=A0A1R3KVY8_9ROSI|nr:hypothetical protein COLO4_03960 [Corchorus olitorius]